MAEHGIAVHQRLLHVIDMAGTFALAVQGASIAAMKGLDALGIAVISLATALGGGILRDLLLGEAPPEALRGSSLILTALAGAALTFFAFHSVEQIPEHYIAVVDAFGLSLLAVAGTEKALEAKLSPVAAVLLGAVSGAGGYTLRDVLLAEIPAILKVDFLASAAILGAIVLVAARKLGLPANLAALAGGATCCVLRLLALLFHWHLPVVDVG